MIDFPTLEDLEVEGKRVMLRGDLDVNIEELKDKKTERQKNLRINTLISTLKYLHKKGARKIIIIGHRGRPDGKVVKSLSLEPMSKVVEEMLTSELGEEEMKKLDMHMMENLRFNKGEKKNDKHLAKHLAEDVDIYVNEAFSASHREHASIVGLPEVIKSRSQSQNVAVGLRFQQEIEKLSKFLDNPKKPVLMTISGIKEDKIAYLNKFSDMADKILVGGRLPEYLPQEDKDLPISLQKGKLLIAKLMPDKEDITLNSVERFEKEIQKAKTILVSGPIGKFEEEGHLQGTKRVFKAVVDNKDAYKVAGGGDTQSAIQLLNLTEGFDWISVGGGAMLEFLTTGTLPGIEALLV